MARKKEETTEANATEVVQGEVATQPAEPGKMEFKLINPTEKGFLRRIEWNKDELEAGVRAKIASYENVVYTEDNMKQAKTDRAELNNLVKAIEERRKKVKAIINEPYDTFEKELKEVTALIQEPVGLIDGQIKEFETQQKEAKKKLIQAVYDENIGELAQVLPFDKIFDTRYLNATYKLTDATREVKEKIDRVKTDLETIDSMESKFKLQSKDVYIKTLDLSKALAENKRLTDLEEKLEAEKRRKAEESVQNTEESVQETQTPAPAEQAVDPFAQKQEEKRFRTKFCAVGSRAQLESLIQFMKENNIEYGRIK